jgi:TolA-binding protein
VVSDRAGTPRAARPRRWLRRGLALVVGLALSVPALAVPAPLKERYDNLVVEVQVVQETAADMTRNVAPGRGFITPDQAEQRYRDYVFLYLVGEYQQAAEGFFSLVTTLALADAGLQWDAEWYLAESVYKMQNLRTARQYYADIVASDDHPFREDAVRRLLEIHVDLEDDEAFQALYEREILSGRVRSSDLITYAVGKAFFEKGDYVQAKSALGDLLPDSPFYRKARYILGAIMVVEGNLETAAQYYRSVVELSVETVDDRRVLDLSLLALGRIYLELGLYEEASTFYSRIASDSEYLDDKLYEEVWTYIKQKEEIRALRNNASDELPEEERELLAARERELIQQALRGIDIFLLAFPEHPYTPRLKLLRGHLHIQAVEYDSAMRSYEQVISEYAPVRERFGELARSTDKPKEYFQQILRLGERFQGTRDQLPAYAVSMVMEDADLSRAITVYRELEQQRQSIATSEAIIEELRSALDNAEGIGGFDAMRYDITFSRSLAVQHHFDLLALEEDLLESALSGSERREVEAVRRDRRKAHDVALEAIAEGDAERVARDIAGIRERLERLRIPVQDPDTLRMLQGIDQLHQVLVAAEDRLASAGSRLGPLEADELDRIRQRFEREVAEVEKQRGTLNDTFGEAEAVSIDLTRSGFGRLEDFFAESVLRADVGIVDVYWAQKVQVSEEKTRVIEERNALRDQISRRFELIEQKLSL